MALAVLKMKAAPTIPTQSLLLLKSEPLALTTQRPQRLLHWRGQLPGRDCSALSAVREGLVQHRPIRLKTPGPRRGGVIAASVATVGVPGETQKLTAEEHFELARLHHKIWHGQWAGWEVSTRELLDSFRMLRVFKEEEHGAKVHHVNTMFLKSGPLVRGPWEYGSSASLPNGVQHPSAMDLRLLLLPGGHQAWVPVNVSLPAKEPIQAELFYIHPEKPDVRVSFWCKYDQNTGLAEKLLLNRENARPNEDEFPAEESFWSRDVELAESRSMPAGQFTGQEVILNSQLELSVQEGSWQGYDYPREGGRDPEAYHVFHLPDNLSFRMPKAIYPGTPFTLCAHWWLSDTRVHQLTARFGPNGDFMFFKGGYYELAKS